MKISKKVNSLILGLAVLLAFGCAKEKDPVPADSLTVLPKCQIVKRYIYYYNLASSPIDSVTYEYDGEKRLSRIHTYPNSSAAFEYQAGKLSKIKYMNHDNLSRYISYDYNAAGQIVKENHFHMLSTGTSLVKWYDYTYNSANKIVRRTIHQPTQVAFDSVYYPAPNKVILKTYFGSVGNEKLSEITEFTLDEKQRPIRFGGAEFHDRILKNNILQETTTINPATNNIRLVAHYAYQYNPDGFPIKILSAMNSAPLQLKESLEYNCQ